MHEDTKGLNTEWQTKETAGQAYSTTDVNTMKTTNLKWKYILAMAFVCCGSMCTNANKQNTTYYVEKRYTRDGQLYYVNRPYSQSSTEHGVLQAMYTRVQKVVHQFSRSLQKWYNKKSFYQIKQLMVCVLTSETLALLSNLFDKVSTSSFVVSLIHHITQGRKNNMFDFFRNAQAPTVANAGRNITHVLAFINFLVFAAWNIGLLSGSQGFISWMDRNFVFDSTSPLRHTAITAAFSHIDLNHFISNMSALYLFVPDVYKSCQENKRLFHYFYVFSSIVSSTIDTKIFKRIPADIVIKVSNLLLKLGEQAVNDFIGSNSNKHDIVKWIQEQKLSFADTTDNARTSSRSSHSGNQSPDEIINRSLGASGILSTMMTYQCLAYPENQYKFGSNTDNQITVYAPLAAAIWSFNDFVVLRSADGIGHGVHLGGSLFGAIVHIIALYSRTSRAKQKSGRNWKLL